MVAGWRPELPPLCLHLARSPAGPQGPGEDASAAAGLLPGPGPALAAGATEGVLRSSASTEERQQCGTQHSLYIKNKTTTEWWPRGSETLSRLEMAVVSGLRPPWGTRAGPEVGAGGLRRPKPPCGPPPQPLLPGDPAAARCPQPPHRSRSSPRQRRSRLFQRQSAG